MFWWGLDNGVHVDLPPADGIFKSGLFPGLWLDQSAIHSGDGKALLKVLAEGIRQARDVG